MTTEFVSVGTEEPTVDLQKNEWVTVREAIIREGISEKSVYNRINSGYYTSKVEGGRKFILLQKRSGTTEAVPVSAESDSVMFQDSSGQLTEHLLNRIQELSEENKELKERLSEALQMLTESREFAARLQGEAAGTKNLLDAKDQIIHGKDETIQAKDQAINAANAAVMLMEQRTPAVEVAPPERQIEAKPPGWMFWKR